MPKGKGYGSGSKLPDYGGKYEYPKPARMRLERKRMSKAMKRIARVSSRAGNPMLPPLTTGRTRKMR